MERKQLFRLCHHCGFLNESDAEILRCTKCTKGFLPLNYFEKLRQKLQGQTAEPLSGSGLSDPAAAFFNPINGLIVFW